MSQDFKWYENFCGKYLSGNCDFGELDDDCEVCCMECEKKCSERCQEGFDD